MKHKSIQYWETFPCANGGWVKMVDEILLEEGDTPRDAFWEGRRTVQSTFYEMKGHDAKIAAEKPKEPDTPQSTEAKIIAQIYGCSDMVVLKTFEKLSKTYPTVKAAYEQQEQKLKQP